MNKILLVGAGGFVGATFRYLLSGFVQRLSGSIDFPYGTLAVNILGCFLIGIFSQLDEVRNVFSAEVRFFLFIGILGAFTTFSTFGNETMNLIVDKRMNFAFLNVSIHIILGLGTVWAGRLIAYFIWR
ncbi:MAG: fluoride efflux transporter CrcB [Desulfobacterales bacterium]|nr:fluoride efflux transporter CrcB [Desulfobacterales bacterium]